MPQKMAHEGGASRAALARLVPKRPPSAWDLAGYLFLLIVAKHCGISLSSVLALLP